MTDPAAEPEPLVEAVAAGYAFEGPVLEAGAEAAAKETPQPEATADEHIGYPTSRPPRRKKQDTTVVQDIITSPVARDLMRTAAREIVRGVFGVGRRR